MILLVIAGVGLAWLPPARAEILAMLNRTCPSRRTWWRTTYLTCMGSQNVIVGDAVEDRPLRSIALPKPYPHGIAIHEGIDRMLVTSTVRATDLKDPGETITVIELSTGKALASPRVTARPQPSGDAPVEILFVPKASPPIAYVTNM